MTHGRFARRVQTASVTNPNAVTASDELFFLLEGQTVESRGHSWRVEVCGVYCRDTERWIQLTLSGPMTCGVTLRTRLMAACDVLDLLRDWLDDSLPGALESCIVSQASVVRHHLVDFDKGGLPTMPM